MALKHFGTDGIRGEYGGPHLNDTIAYRSGLAMARLLAGGDAGRKPVLLAGRDTRNSGKKLLAALAAGFEAGGGKLESLGVAPTPAIAKIVSMSSADAGCSITASHNPSEDNGLKFFGGRGTKPTEAFERDLDLAVDGAEAPLDSDFPEVQDTASYQLETYTSSVLGDFPAGFLSGSKIAIDCANGAFSDIAPHVFQSFGASTEVVGDEPDGSNINRGVGSEYWESLAALMSAGEFDMGFAFDGDGDRMVAFDSAGRTLSGEASLGVLAIRMRRAGTLAGNTLVTTNQSNLGLDSALAKRGILVERVDIGDKHVSRLMLQGGYSLGGEESGHFVFGDFSMTGDGLYSALKLAESVVASGQSLGELASFYHPYPIEKRAIPVRSKPPLGDCSNIASAMRRLEHSFGENGRLLVRYSGTEPKIRLLIEAKTKSLAADAMTELECAVKEDLG